MTRKMTLARPEDGLSSEPTEATSQPPAISRSAESLRSIAERAYELYEQRGRHDGHDLEDWLEAERQILASRT